MQKNECVSIIGKWRMVEHAGSYVNTLDILSFYKNNKADCPPETDEFTYHLIKSSLIIYNKGFGEQHFKMLKLSMTALDVKGYMRIRLTNL